MNDHSIVAPAFAAAPVASRGDFIASTVVPGQKILEIAPYFNPIAAKSWGNVTYTDVIENAEIRRKAADNPGVAGRLPPDIDFVWTPGAALADCSPIHDFDCIIASHVVEHVPDPLGWINQLLSVLKIGGRVVLLVPDRRQGPDFYRNETRFHDIAAMAIDQPSIPTALQILDFTSHSVVDTGEVGARPFDRGAPIEDANKPWTDAVAVDTAIWAANEGGYLDVHCTVWTPASFHDAMSRAVAVGFLNVEIGSYFLDLMEFGTVFTKLGEPSLRYRRKIADPKPRSMGRRLAAALKRRLLA